MRADLFWQKVKDFYDIHHGKYLHAVITDDEKRDTVTDFLSDIEGLTGEWYSPDFGEINKEGG